MARITSFLLLLLSSLVISAQFNLNKSGLEKYNYYINNPAFIASDSLINIDVIYYKQGTKFENSPEELLVTGNIPLHKINSGILINYNHNSIGNIVTDAVRLGYSFQYKINELVFKFGISSSIIKLSFKNKWVAPDGSDGSSDPYIPNNTDSKKYYLENSYGLGFNFRQITGGISLVGHDIDIGDGNNFNNSSLIYCFMSYNMKALSWLELDPTISWHIEDKLELSIISTFYQNYRLGVSYKLGDRSEFIASSKKENLFSLSAGATVFEHAYVNVVFNPNYYPYKTESLGYNLLFQVGCRF